MKTVSFLIVCILALLFVIVVGAILVAVMFLRCEDCPYKEECESNKDFVCPFHDYDFNNPNLSF